MHTFSMTCKAESVLDLFGDPLRRRTAISWFRDHSISKLYVESYRHGRFVPEERLRVVRDEFRAAGFEVGGCITPTNLAGPGNDKLVGCYTDTTVLDRLQKVVERTARVFDFFIIDDFLFTYCECSGCKALRSGRSWDDMRSALMLRVGKERILGPAKAVNPRVRVIIKYPLWYEQYRGRGYDVVGGTEAYDAVWIGTETRDPDSDAAGRRPQTAACWIQGWMYDIGKGKCGGGWYDPIDTGPRVFLEQARQTILGGAKESLLHCYDYLGTDTPGVAIHGKDMELAYGRSDAAAFRNEVGGLDRLAGMVEKMEPYGVLVPCNPAQTPKEYNERYLPGFTGMLGIPMQPAASLSECPAAFLGMQAFGFDGLPDFIAEAYGSGTPLVVTEALRNALAENGGDIPAVLRDAPVNESGTNGIVHCTDTLMLLRCPTDLWDLTSLPPEVQDDVRNRLLEPYGIKFTAPGKVSLHLFRSGPERCEVIENFNDAPVSVRLRYGSGNDAERTLRLALPDSADASVGRGPSGEYALTLPPRSLLVLATPGMGTGA